jgi:hypothetical protein
MHQACSEVLSQQPYEVSNAVTIILILQLAKLMLGN